MGSFADKYRIRQKGNRLIVGGLVGILAAFFLGASFDDSTITSVLAISAGILAFITLVIGLGCYAKSKGYPAALGAIGLLGLPGIIILVVLPDNWKVPAPPIQADPNTNYLRDPKRL